MFSKVGQIMLYVNDQDESLAFWTEVAGFHIVDEVTLDEGMRWIEIAPTKDSQTSIVLHDKEVVARMSEGVNLGTPSLMFFTDDLDRLYADLSAKHVTVGEIIEMPTGRVFNFADNEKNYFAVMERKG
ncbi:VOC family protein [Paenibacillus barcinonensis]|uniref:Lactoylglutathione lyase n=1 Tax=Paenibacillus barcinonensis TaxID=198119 RepID=A0A2V4VGB5_PAEBA|nr:VOC family protein [Paenibacillus barcinonensis]PYE47778.1 lactoylglutathione lyase [Paenibacillus barcinonensis]QKS59111.1 VOC family protein [Paenibacillus barcinonensis]